MIFKYISVTTSIIFMKISFVIPVMKEEEGLKNTIKTIPFSKLKKYKTEIVVVWTPLDDTDRTGDVAKKLGAKLVIEKRKGYGRAYKTGFKNATGDIICTMDADCTYPVQDFPELIKTLIEKDVDFINTDRFAGLGKGTMKFTHIFGNRVLTLIGNVLFGLKLKDSHSGMWVFRKNILKKLNLKEDGMTLSTEIKIKAFRKVRAIEVPSRYFSREGFAKLRGFDDGVKHLKYLIWLRLSGKI